MTRTIDLSDGELFINTSLTITGPGAGSLTLDGLGSNRAFHVFSGDVSISGMTITGGIESGTGGGILMRFPASLNLSDSVVTGNAANYGGGSDLRPLEH